MNCPRCKSELVEKKLEELEPEGTFGEVIVDVCSSCSGIWFDKGELERVDNKIEPKIIEIKSIPSKDDQYKTLECPKCSNDMAMEKVVSDLDKDVVMDACPKCNGVWLYRGEYKAIKERSLLNMAFSVFKWMLS